MNWIYCSERVPDHNNDVLVTVSGGWVTIDRYVTEDGDWYGDAEVIAWCELPEPAEVKK